MLLRHRSLPSLADGWRIRLALILSHQRISIKAAGIRSTAAVLLALQYQIPRIDGGAHPNVRCEGPAQLGIRPCIDPAAAGIEITAIATSIIAAAAAALHIVLELFVVPVQILPRVLMHVLHAQFHLVPRSRPAAVPILELLRLHVHDFHVHLVVERYYVVYIFDFVGVKLGDVN